MSGFTKGPWRVDDRVHGKESGIVHIKSDGHSEMCTMFASALENEDEFLANAHLIAAAPELYECLEFLCAWLKGQGFGDTSDKALPGEYDYAIEVLAKARGEAKP